MGPICVYLAVFLVFIFAALIGKGDVSALLNSPLMSPVLFLAKKLGIWVLLLPPLWGLAGFMFCGLFQIIFDIELLMPEPGWEERAKEDRKRQVRKELRKLGVAIPDEKALADEAKKKGLLEELKRLGG